MITKETEKLAFTCYKTDKIVVLRPRARVISEKEKLVKKIDWNELLDIWTLERNKRRKVGYVVWGSPALSRTADTFGSGSSREGTRVFTIY